MKDLPLEMTVVPFMLGQEMSSRLSRTEGLQRPSVCSKYQGRGSLPYKESAPRVVKSTGLAKAKLRMVEARIRMFDMLGSFFVDVGESGSAY